MSLAADYIAVDWGTTNRRAFQMTGAGAVKRHFRDDRGVLSVSPDGYEAEIAAIRDRLGPLPIIAAGMIGSTRGWRDVPYVDAPADLAALAHGACRMPLADTVILPGVALRGPRADVMRGEEIQVLGAIAAGFAPADALFCQPGTHNKWIATQGARITDIATVMTGEIFALVRAHGTLSGMLDAPVADGPGFQTGLKQGLEQRDALTALFGVRAGVLLGTIAPDQASSFASGLLIGADVASRDDLRGRTIYLLGTGSLVDLYATAIRAAGGDTVTLDGDRAFAAGIHPVWEMLV